MKAPFSIVIMCKDAARHIAATIESVQHLSDDIVIYDTGSTDNTIEIAGKYSVQIYTGNWEGYGKSRRKATEKTKHDWVLTIDSDESAEPTLKKELTHLLLQEPKIVYAIRLRNFIGDKEFKWGEWGSDYRPRLFHKNWAQWNEAIVHEQLILNPATRQKKVNGTIHHQYANDFNHYGEKLVHYAFLTAEKYYKSNKKSTWVKRYLSPLYTFVKAYVLRLGFLDGHAGFLIAHMTARYTYLKYGRLRELWEGKGRVD